MKATIKFKYKGNRVQRTIEVEENEPCSILRELIKIDARVDRYTYVTTIKCRRYIYQWYGDLRNA